MSALRQIGAVTRPEPLSRAENETERETRSSGSMRRNVGGKLTCRRLVRVSGRDQGWSDKAGSEQDQNPEGPDEVQVLVGDPKFVPLSTTIWIRRPEPLEVPLTADGGFFTLKMVWPVNVGALGALVTATLTPVEELRL